MIIRDTQYAYAKELAYLHNWNYTTVIRTHYAFKPHIASKKVQQLVSDGVCSNAFMTLEPDRDYYDNYTRTVSSNHLHLLLHIPSKINSYSLYRGYMSEAMGVNRKAILDIQPVRSNKQLTQYITKQLSMKGSHHDYFTNTTNF